MSDFDSSAFIESLRASLTTVRCCKACKRKNRIRPDNKKPRCGGCGLPL